MAKLCIVGGAFREICEFGVCEFGVFIHVWRTE